jgi:hypothetical protein
MTMRDPKPDNISGEKVQRHVFKHEINWGYVAVAVALIVVAYRLDLGGDDGEETEVSL